MQTSPTTPRPNFGTCAQLIIWQDCYNTGVTEIDRQHQNLIKLVNELHSSLLSGKAKQMLEEILSELIKYTIYHFGTEEKFFDQYAYPWTAGHRKEHAAFTKKIMGFEESFKTGKENLSLDILNYLCVWLKDHICERDRRACNFLINKGVR